MDKDRVVEELDVIMSYVWLLQGEPAHEILDSCLAIYSEVHNG